MKICRVCIGLAIYVQVDLYRFGVVVSLAEAFDQCPMRSMQERLTFLKMARSLKCYAFDRFG